MAAGWQGVVVGAGVQEGARSCGGGGCGLQRQVGRGLLQVSSAAVGRSDKRGGWVAECGWGPARVAGGDKAESKPTNKPPLFCFFAPCGPAAVGPNPRPSALMVPPVGPALRGKPQSTLTKASTLLFLRPLRAGCGRTQPQVLCSFGATCRPGVERQTKRRTPLYPVVVAVAVAVLVCGCWYCPVEAAENYARAL